MSINVLSLFDGISCAQIALQRANIKIENYCAAEVDKYAIQITQHNYPNTVQMGDVKKWREWDLDWSSIDLVSAGFPCQSWSLAGKQLGDKDERGMLFWVMLDIIAHVLKHNPGAKFMMENVRMKREFEEYITHHTDQALGVVHKTLINSALVSAQNRNRYYWANFEVSQPDDKGLALADILESGVVDRDKEHCIDANYFKGGNLKSYFEKNRRQLVFCGRMVGRKISPETGRRDDYNPDLKAVQRIELRPDNKSGTITTVQKDNLVVFNKSVSSAAMRGRGFEVRRDAKANALLSGWHQSRWLATNNLPYRKLTPLECERLQTVPDNYTLVTDAQGKQLVSNTQRYKALGNGFTVDVIAHIFSHI